MDTQSRRADEQPPAPAADVKAPLPPARAAVWNGDRPTRRQIEADLRVRVELKGPRTIQAGTEPWVSSTLVNTSLTRTHRVVRPGDGSDPGWREPHVYWTATLDRGDGKPVPVPQAEYARCGNFAGDWPTDAMPLGPRGEIPLDSWSGPLPDFQQAGRVRLRRHYAYQAGKGRRSRCLVEAGELGLMEGVPSFEIVSAPVEFDVVRPLDVRVKVKRVLKVHQKVRLSDLIEVVLVNQSRGPVECSSPTRYDAHLGFDIRGQFRGWGLTLNDGRSSPSGGGGPAPGPRRALRPGEAVSLLGPGEFVNGLDGTWEYPVEDTVRLRAVYSTPTSDEERASIRSEWVEIRVEK